MSRILRPEAGAGGTGRRATRFVAAIADWSGPRTPSPAARFALRAISSRAPFLNRGRSDPPKPARADLAKVPGLLNQYRQQRAAWLAQADELVRMREEVQEAAEREALEIVTAARRDVRRIIVEARRELLVLTAQMHAAVEATDAPGLPLPTFASLLADPEHARADDAPGDPLDITRDVVLEARKGVRSVLDEARAEIEALSSEAPAALAAAAAGAPASHVRLAGRRASRSSSAPRRSRTTPHRPPAATGRAPRDRCTS